MDQPTRALISTLKGQAKATQNSPAAKQAMTDAASMIESLHSMLDIANGQLERINGDALAKLKGK